MADASPFDDFDVPAEDGGDPVQVEEEEDAFAAKPAAPEKRGQQAPAPQDDVDDFGQLNGDASGHADQDPFAQAQAQDQDVAPEDDGYQKESKQPEDVFAAPTALSLWERDRRVVIDDRIRKAEQDKAKAAVDGKAEIAQFYQARGDALQRTQQANRSEEKNTKQDMDALMKGGTLWEKVGKLANLQPKAGQSEKTARMRNLLIKLKNDKVDYDGEKKGAGAGSKKK